MRHWRPDRLTKEQEASFGLLVEVAERARTWFDNKSRGNGFNGQYDDLLIGRDLGTALEAVGARAIKEHEALPDDAGMERRR